MKKWFWRTLFVPLVLLAAITIYLVAALAGAVIPAETIDRKAAGPLLEKPIYLFGTLLHMDIAIPVNSLTLTRFAFLRDVGFPLDNPALEYLVIGWGARGFYTQTADYADIEFSIAWDAATGDQSVVHIGPSGDPKHIEGARAIQLTEQGFANMLHFMLASFSRDPKGPIRYPGSFGFGDVFYESPYRFDIFRPCNVWASGALQAGGLRTGIWTPTAYSLEMALALHND